MSDQTKLSDGAAVNAESAAKLVSDEQIECAAKAIYDHYLFRDSTITPTWVDRGNSHQQDTARTFARVALEAASLIERHATPQTQATHGDQNLTAFGKRLQEFEHNPSFDRVEANATHGEGEATLLPDMLRASIADTEFAVQVIRDLCPEGIEDQCDECGGDPARCHEVQPNCPYPRARLLIAATHPAPSPTADLDRE